MYCISCLAILATFSWVWVSLKGGGKNALHVHFWHKRRMKPGKQPAEVPGTDFPKHTTELTHTEHIISAQFTSTANFKELSLISPLWSSHLNWIHWKKEEPKQVKSCFFPIFKLSILSPRVENINFPSLCFHFPLLMFPTSLFSLSLRLLSKMRFPWTHYRKSFSETKVKFAPGWWRWYTGKFSLFCVLSFIDLNVQKFPNGSWPRLPLCS